MSTKLLTTQQAAIVLGISDGRLRQLIGAALAHPKEQVGGTWLFTPKEVERLRTRRTNKTGLSYEQR